MTESMELKRWTLVIPPEGGARAIAKSILRSLGQSGFGFNVSVFDTKEYRNLYTSLLRSPDPDTVTDLINQSLAVHCINHETDVVLVTSLCPVTLFCLSVLGKAGIKRVHWFYEDYRRAGYWKQVASGYDLFSGIQRGDLEKALEDTDTGFQYLPVACDSDSPVWEQDKAERDISFVGIPTGYRISFLEGCARAGHSLAVGGLGWDRYSGILEKWIVADTWVERGRYLEITSMGRVGLNLSFSNPEGSRDRTHLPPRVFDILSMGMPLFTEDVSLLGETLPGYRFNTFMGLSGFIDQVKVFLGSKQELNSSDLLKNREMILRDHTWGSRITSLATRLGIDI